MHEELCPHKNRERNFLALFHFARPKFDDKLANHRSHAVVMPKMQGNGKLQFCENSKHFNLKLGGVRRWKISS